VPVSQSASAAASAADVCRASKLAPVVTAFILATSARDRAMTHQGPGQPGKHGITVKGEGSP